MLQQPDRLHFVIADISGYTEYLAGVELDHAQDILADLVSTVVTALRPAFRLAKLEGDAAFCYAPAENLDGSLLLDTIERCYFGFRRRRRDVRQATSCECRACVRIPNLNLKFVAHTGLAIRQRLAGGEELLGSEVIVVHRLLKNGIVDELGIGAYAALTAQLASEIGIDPAALGMVRRSETYEHVGTIRLWVQDLERRWRAEDAGQRVFVDDGQAMYEVHRHLKAPPQTAWEFVTMPGHRVQWQAPGGIVAVEQQPGGGGRRGAGTVNHCIHGPNAWIEEILDWRPYDYVTHRTKLPGDGPTFLSTYEFEPTAEGTAIHFRVMGPTQADIRKLQIALPDIDRAYQEELDLLEGMTADEAQARSAAYHNDPPLPERHAADGFLDGIAPMRMLA
jgi:uncharacterized protein YndB with AHSA1/START domain